MSKCWSERDKADYRFIRIPRVFVTGFADVSLQAKWVYAILLDRLMLSKKNHDRFSDENGLFLYFKQDEMAALLGITTRAIKTLFAELKEKGLIETRREGLGRPQKIYITKLSELSGSEIRGEENFPSEVKKTSPRGEENFTSEVKKTSLPIKSQTYRTIPTGTIQRERIGNPPKFVPPTVEEVQAYIAEKGYTFSAEKFVANNAQKGWYIGNTPMRDWKAACLVWESNQARFAKGSPAQGTSPQNLDKKWGVLSYDEYMRGENDGRKSQSLDWGFIENLPPDGYDSR